MLRLGFTFSFFTVRLDEFLFFVLLIFLGRFKVGDFRVIAVEHRFDVFRFI